MSECRYVRPEHDLAKAVSAIQRMLVAEQIRRANRADKVIEYYQKKKREAAA